jgi:hypothetical protein
MSTRSDIIVQRRDGSFARIYSHWDGYLAHNGRILFEHYNNQERAEELVSHGDISSLGPHCDKPNGHCFEHRVEGHTVYYGRDRGETGTDAEVFDSLSAAWPSEDTWTEFTYVWKDGAWWVGDADEGTQSLVLLSLALAGIAEPKPDVKYPWGVIRSRKRTAA